MLFQAKTSVSLKYFVTDAATCICENCKYLASIIDNPIITCDESIWEAKTAPTNFNQTKITCKTKPFYISFAFSLTTIVLLVVLSIYCYLIKYQIKQKHLWPC